MQRNPIRPLVMAAVVLASMVSAAEAIELQWFGQSAFKITADNGTVILIDPFITNNPVTPEEHKDLSGLGNIDLILVTHGHGDHVGDTVEIAKMTGAKVGMNADMGQTFAALGWLPMEQLIRFNKSGSISPADGITVTMVRAEHSSTVLDKDPETGGTVVHPGGEPVGYILEFENGFRLYHAGDTGVFGDMAMIGSYYRPDLAMLPIGGHFTMDPYNAAFAVTQLLEVDRVLPIHYGTFPPLKGTPEQFKQALGDYDGEVIVMAPGETRSFQD